MIYILVLCGLTCVLEHELFFLEVFYIKQELPINEQIREKEVQVIDEDGKKLGTMKIFDAISKASEKELDLVLVSPNVTPPVCKIMNYGKYKFEQAKKEKEAKKNQKTFDVKEIRITPNIEEHDFSYKAKNARKFLEDGDKVKITVRFRGRELNYVKLGQAVLDKFIQNLEDISVVEKKPILEGKNMFIILAKKA
jgi:translation initiation factor IF-3